MCRSSWTDEHEENTKYVIVTRLHRPTRMEARRFCITMTNQAKSAAWQSQQQQLNAGVELIVSREACVRSYARYIKIATWSGTRGHWLISWLANGGNAYFNMRECAFAIHSVRPQISNSNNIQSITGSDCPAMYTHSTHRGVAVLPTTPSRPWPCSTLLQPVSVPESKLRF